MTLKEKINDDFITAMKSKNVVAKGILSVVKGEIQTVEKNIGSDNLSDSEVNKILTKIAKSLNETIKTLTSTDRSENLVQACAELAIVQSYLPKQMSKDEVTEKVTALVGSGITQIGAIMKEFSTLPVDKKMVSEVIKEVVG